MFFVIRPFKFNVNITICCIVMNLALILYRYILIGFMTKKNNQ